MNDPDPFDDITKANKNQLIDISVWSILKSNLSPDKYEYSEDGMIIPEEDVTAEFHKLFGTDTEPEHATVNGYGYTFTYDSAKHTYSIPLTGIVPTYTPDVIKVQKKKRRRGFDRRIPRRRPMGTKQRRRYGSSRTRQIYENHFKGKRRQLLYKFNSGYIFARDGKPPPFSPSPRLRQKHPKPPLPQRLRVKLSPSQTAPTHLTPQPRAIRLRQTQLRRRDS